MATKYWIANNPNGEVTDAQVQSLKALSVSDLAEVESLLADIPMTAEVDVVAATAATGDSDNTEILADVEAIRVKLNALLTKLRATGLLTS